MNELAKAWHMRVNQGMSYEQIGEALNYTGAAIQKQLHNGFKRLSSAKIYRLAQEFCFETCDGAFCNECKLSEFITTKLIKKDV